MLSQLSNSSPGSEGSGSFLDHVPVEPWDVEMRRDEHRSPIGSQNIGHGHVRKRPDGVKVRCGGPAICKVCQKEKALLEMQCLVPHATEDESSSRTTGLSHVPELVDCLTLLAQQIVENNNLMRELIQTQKELAKAINEDAQSGDDEELPRTYLDGSRVL